MRHRISQVDGHIDSEEEDSEEVDAVTLELDDFVRHNRSQTIFQCIASNQSHAPQGWQRFIGGRTINLTRWGHLH